MDFKTNFNLSSNNEYSEVKISRKTDKSKITEVHGEIDNVAHGDKSDELLTEKDDKVVDEKVEESAVIAPEKHTSGQGGERKVMSIIVSIIIVILVERLW